MKKMILAIVVTLFAANISAGTLKVCAKQATEICKDLEGSDFTQCHNSQMSFCMEDLGLKSLDLETEYSCEMKCFALPDSQIPMCLSDCLHEI
ncbi:MAG: hypothetical protein BM556_10325 [Bacteriovorax sp. MedPE-SWde]|nr:MAG: hypothetical protein BM556_10325 [Bacteriovorax sp. MedPE-SWde]